MQVGPRPKPHATAKEHPSHDARGRNASLPTARRRRSSPPLRPSTRTSGITHDHDYSDGTGRARPTNCKGSISTNPATTPSCCRRSHLTVPISGLRGGHPVWTRLVQIRCPGHSITTEDPCRLQRSPTHALGVARLNPDRAQRAQIWACKHTLPGARARRSAGQDLRHRSLPTRRRRPLPS
jgi:hypothetical protein